MYQAGTRAGHYQLAAIALGGLCETGAHFSIPQSLLDGFGRADSSPKVLAGTGRPTVNLTTLPIVKLINEAQEISGLTLELIAPLLGVSRRAIQYWKDGENASIKKEALVIDVDMAFIMVRDRCVAGNA